MLEYLPKGDLTEMMKSHPYGLPLESVRNIGSQVAKGLSVIHKANVIHRDLKPNNILVTKNQDIKICDFSCSVKTSDQVKVRGAVGTL